MVCKLENERLVLIGEQNILKENKSKIEALNNNNFFIHKLNNKIGRDLVYYMCNSMHYNLSNPEPVDLKKNTLSKVLSCLKVIDENVKLPLSKYNFKVMNDFIRDFTNGNIKGKGNKPINPKAITYYIGEFRRFWKIYRQYSLHKDKDNYDELFFDWGLNLKAPKTSRSFQDIPDISIDKIKELSENLYNEEYKVRTLVSINLMARKCEASELRYNQLKFKDQSIFIKLPKVKKHSTAKTEVELFEFVKDELNKYLSHNSFKADDKIFPSRDEAFAKNLKKISKEILKVQIAPKMLRKLGLSVCEELGYDRGETERIGGWAANSPVVEHYYKRNKTILVKDRNKKIDETLNKDLRVELDKQKIENNRLREDINNLHSAVKQIFEGLIHNKDFTQNVEEYNKKIDMINRVLN